MYCTLSQKFGSRNQGVTKRGRSGQIETHLHCFLSPSDIQEFYEVTLLDSQRWVESSKTPDAVTAVTLWDFSSLQSTAVTSDTLPSLSTSIEVNCMSCDLPSTGVGCSAEAVDRLNQSELGYKVLQKLHDSSHKYPANISLFLDSLLYRQLRLHSAAALTHIQPCV